MLKLQAFNKWIKKNKKPLIIAGISTTALIALYFGINSNNVIKGVPEIVEDIADKETKITNHIVFPDISTEPFSVSQHIRNLPKGQNASLEKLIEAKQLGIILKEGQTLVDGYYKGLSAA